MMAGWVRWSGQYHWPSGTGLPRRVRPNTWYPVYLGLARIEYRPPRVQPTSGSAGG